MYIVLLAVSLALLFVSFVSSVSEVHAASRIKDIVAVEGIRDNILVGYGLVVGLNGTGDKITNSVFTEKSLQGFLERLGINTKGEKLKVKNVAAVTITATLPPFARTGSRVDVTVSALGDAKSLQGGMLIATPLMAADGDVYAVAQGAIAIGGFEASGKSGTSISKGVPTNGFVANGAIIEREVAFELNSLGTIKLALRNPDILTASRIAKKINSSIDGDIAVMLDPGTVSITVPNEYRNSVATLLSEIEPLRIEPDQTAKIIIDEASGTIVMNENVSIDTVAIAQGNLVVTIKEKPAVSQPNALSSDKAETVTADITSVSVDEGAGNKMTLLKKSANLSDLVGGLNALGVGPRDLINILQIIKASGALQAEIVMR